MLYLGKCVFVWKTCFIWKYMCYMKKHVSFKVNMFCLKKHVFVWKKQVSSAKTCFICKYMFTLKKNMSSKKLHFIWKYMFYMKKTCFIWSNHVLFKKACFYLKKKKNIETFQNFVEYQQKPGKHRRIKIFPNEAKGLNPRTNSGHLAVLWKSTDLFRSRNA